ncbi:Molybdopterin synthase sulfur carrier subunit [compost metagenome]
MMEIKIISFGQIAEITGKEFMLEATDLDSLKLYLIKKFPELSDKKFAFAVNKKLVQENTSLNQNDVVALMPPYSGG